MPTQLLSKDEKGYMNNPSISISLGGSFDFLKKRSIAKEIKENTGTKLYDMLPSIISAAANLAMLVFVLAAGAGVYVPFDTPQIGLVCFAIFILCLICFALTLNSLDKGFSTLLGFVMSSQRGYSLVACLFLQSSTAKKFSFPGLLSIRSSTRTWLSYISYIWLFQAITIFLPIFIASSIKMLHLETEGATLPCISFNDDGYQYDRGFPSLESEMGVASNQFAWALVNGGEDVSGTDFVLSPQPITSAKGLKKLMGPGITGKIYSSCQCTPLTDVTAINAALTSNYWKLTRGGIANHVFFDNDNAKVQSVLHANRCGGTNLTAPIVPFCTTTFVQPEYAQVLVHYSEQGSERVAKLEIDSLQNKKLKKDWVYVAIKSIIAENSAIALDSDPGFMNPILWSATGSKESIDNRYLEDGVEVAMAVILRGGIKRSFSSIAGTCQSFLASSSTVLLFSELGISLGSIFFSFNLILSFICMIPSILWIRSELVSSLGIRLARSPVYFAIVFHDMNIPNYDANAPEFFLMQKLDKVVSYGESISTMNDPVEGKLAIDKPTLVKRLALTKKYC
jgi:hypothetical protein